MQFVLTVSFVQGNDELGESSHHIDHLEVDAAVDRKVRERLNRVRAALTDHPSLGESQRLAINEVFAGEGAVPILGEERASINEELTAAISSIAVKEVAKQCSISGTRNTEENHPSDEPGPNCPPGPKSDGWRQNGLEPSSPWYLNLVAHSNNLPKGKLREDDSASGVLKRCSETDACTTTKSALASHCECNDGVYEQKLGPGEIFLIAKIINVVTGVINSFPFTVCPRKDFEDVKDLKNCCSGQTEKWGQSCVKHKDGEGTELAGLPMCNRMQKILDDRNKILNDIKSKNVHHKSLDRVQRLGEGSQMRNVFMHALKVLTKAETKPTGASWRSGIGEASNFGGIKRAARKATTAASQRATQGAASAASRAGSHMKNAAEVVSKTKRSSMLKFLSKLIPKVFRPFLMNFFIKPVLLDGTSMSTQIDKLVRGNWFDTNDERIKETCDPKEVQNSQYCRTKLAMDSLQDTLTVVRRWAIMKFSKVNPCHEECICELVINPIVSTDMFTFVHGFYEGGTRKLYDLNKSEREKWNKGVYKKAPVAHTTKFLRMVGGKANMKFEQIKDDKIGSRLTLVKKSRRPLQGLFLNLNLTQSNITHCMHDVNLSCTNGSTGEDPRTRVVCRMDVDVSLFLCTTCW